MLLSILEASFVVSDHVLARKDRTLCMLKMVLGYMYDYTVIFTQGGSRQGTEGRGVRLQIDFRSHAAF